MPKIVFHIGTHKTGTTAIQNRLFSNRKTLLNNGILYPDAGVRRGHSGHHEFAWAAAGQSHRLKGKSIDEVFHEVQSSIDSAGDKTVVFSSEEFGNLNVNQIIDMKSRLSIQSAKIVFYLRNQVDYLISQYKQHIQQYETRYTGTLFDYVVEFNILNRMAYAALAFGWANVFGDESLRIRVYDRSCLLNCDVVQDFCNVIGFDCRVLPHFSDVENDDNKSVSDFAAEVLRYANKFDFSPEEHRELLNQIRKTSSDYSNYCFLDVSSMERVRDRFSRSNERISQRFSIDVSPLNELPCVDGKNIISQSDSDLIKAFLSFLGARYFNLRDSF